MPDVAPFISVIIPVRDRYEALLRCLASLNCQLTPPSFEVIIIDDGSRHAVESQLRVGAYSFPLRTVRQEPLGISAARNRGLSASRSGAALFIDSDCEADPKLLHAFAAALDRHPEDIAFQASLHGRCDQAAGRIEDLRLQAILHARTQPDGRIFYLNTSGFLLKRNEAVPWPEVFDLSAVRDEDTLLLARLAAMRVTPRLVPSAMVHHVPDASLVSYLWKQMSIGYRSQAVRDRIGKQTKIYLAAGSRRKVFDLIRASAPPSIRGLMDMALVLAAYAFERMGRLAFRIWGMKPGRATALTAVIDSVTEPEVMARIIAAAEAHRGLTVTYLNGWTLVLTYQDRCFARELKQFDICYADGVGVIYALVLSCLKRVRKVTANNFFFSLCAEVERRGLSLALIGARPGIARELAGNLHARFPSLCLPVVGSGFLSQVEEEQMLQELREHGVRIVIIGRGQPLQERWALQLAKALPKTVIFCVGGLFDYTTGRVIPTPQWIRRLGFEWLHRFCCHPVTYWRYYLVGIPLFFLYILRHHLETPGRAFNRFFPRKPTRQEY